MIFVDKTLEQLEKDKRPIRVGLVGAGFAGRGFALQLVTGAIPGMRLVAISNRTLAFAHQAYADAAATDVEEVKTSKEFSSAVKSNKYAITSDSLLLSSSPHVDVIVEATGEVEFGSRVAIDAIKHKKHLVLINAELDATLGPILKTYADKAGVVYTQADGDQPAVLMNLYREVRMLGFKPVMVGNIKSLTDPYRTPETQKKFAEEHFQRPKFITSFADGTKISFEMATIANATGFPVAKRGMAGPKCSRVEEAAKLFMEGSDPSVKDRILHTGLTDYILGAEPSFGVFVLGYDDHPIRQRYMSVYKMGEGPIYAFYRPFHLSPLEAPLSVARVALFHDAALAPKGNPICDVVTIAKRDLKKGELLDGIGGFTCYGMIDNADIFRKENLLPMGLSDGCLMKQDVPIDTAITYRMVELPPDRLADNLKGEQNNMFSEK